MLSSNSQDFEPFAEPAGGEKIAIRGDNKTALLQRRTRQQLYSGGNERNCGFKAMDFDQDGLMSAAEAAKGSSSRDGSVD